MTETAVEAALAVVNEARRAGRPPSLDDFGGVSSIDVHRRGLAESDAAGEIASAITRAWSELGDTRSSIAFLRSAVEGAPPQALRQVVDSVVSLPVLEAGRIVASVLDAANSADDTYRSEVARDCAVRLAAAGATTWTVAGAVATAKRPSAVGWPGASLAARTARRLVAFDTSSCDQTVEFLSWLSDVNPEHADPRAASGAVHLLVASANPDRFQTELPLARSEFVAATTLDPEHHEAAFAGAITSIVLSVGQQAEQGANDHAEEAASAFAQLAQFGFSDPDVGLPASTYAAWAHAAVLAERATTLASDRFSNAPSSIVIAAADALRAAAAVPLQGGSVITALRSSAAFASELIDTMRHLLSMPEGDLDGRIASLLAEVESLGKGDAGDSPARRIEAISSELVNLLIEAGRSGDAALAANIGADPLAGSPAFDDQLSKILRRLNDDRFPDETRRRAVMVIAFVLRYVTRKAEATRAFGGFRSLAGAAIDEPAEIHIQKDFAQTFAVSALGDGWVDEKTNVSSGRVDGVLRVGRDDFPIEFKAEKDDASPEALRRYVGQANRYTGASAPFALLIVLDLTPGDRYNDISEQSWITKIPPASQGRARYVLTAVIPANSSTPSVLSKPKPRPKTSKAMPAAKTDNLQPPRRPVSGHMDDANAPIGRTTNA